MACNEQARARRRCTATTRDGQRCQGWAMWDSTATDGRQVCGIHAGRHHRGPMGPLADLLAVDGVAWLDAIEALRNADPFWSPHAPHRYAQYLPCTCAAYAWPHRPGGGLCRWPDPPMRISPTPSGTRHFLVRLRRRRLQ
jgi:hypothetical protein